MTTVLLRGPQSDVPDAVRSAASAEPAADMADLAARVRALIGLDAAQQVQLPLGGSLFDAVITADCDMVRSGVLTMLDSLPGGCGPVLHQPGSAGEVGWLYWLVPPGTSGEWVQRPQGVCVGEGYTLTVPSPNYPTRDRYWLRRFEDGRYVPAQVLAARLLSVADSATPQLHTLAEYLRRRP